MTHGISIRVALIAFLGFGEAGAARAEVLAPDTGIDWTLGAKEITAHCKDELARTRADIKQIDGRNDPQSFASGLGAIEEAAAKMQDDLSAHVVLAQISPDKAVRDASAQCFNDVAAFGVELAADQGVYAAAQRAVTSAVTPEEHQLAKIYVENGRRAGASLDATHRARVEKLLNQINELQTDFGRALGEETSEIALSADELKPLPESLNGSLKREGEGARLSVNESTSDAFLHYETSRAARIRYLTAYDRLGGPGNVKRLKQAVLLRKQIATLLGFPSWAAYQLDVKMAKTPQRAEGLVMQVDQALIGKARDEITVLSALKRTNGDSTRFTRADYRFYEHLLVSTQYSVDEERVRQYFPVDKAVPAMLDIYAKLLGVRFQQLEPAQAWAPGVTEFAIYDSASGAAIGWFYLDLYPRFGKYNHFAAFQFRAGRILPDGGYRKPVAAIIGNWPAPAPGKPSLLSYDDMKTFFHEFGHIMHETLSQTRFASLYGPATRSDFPEAPSQMLENWMQRPEVLKKISSKVDTGEPLPDDLITRLVALEHVDDGMHWCRQAAFGIYDLRLHGPTPPADTTSVFFNVWDQLVPLKEISGTYPEASFIHIMSGVDAGYYGYLWSLVYAQDMYSVFAQEGIDNPAIGRRYREEILVPGGAAEPEVLLQNFLKRPVSFDPVYEHLGITKH